MVRPTSRTCPVGVGEIGVVAAVAGEFRQQLVGDLAEPVQHRWFTDRWLLLGGGVEAFGRRR